MTGPRVSLLDVESAIVAEHYFTAAHGVAASGGVVQSDDDALRMLTFCVLVLHNGTRIVGINYGAIDPAQHDAERGRRDAREDAIRQVWPLLGYALRERLAAGT